MFHRAARKLASLSGMILAIMLGMSLLAGCTATPAAGTTTAAETSLTPPANAAAGWQDQPHGVHYWDANVNCWRMNYYIWPKDVSDPSHGLNSWYVFFVELPGINADNETWNEPQSEYPSPNMEVYYDQKDPERPSCFHFHCNWDPTSRWGQAAPGFRCMSVINGKISLKPSLVVDLRVPNKPGEEGKPMTPPPTPPPVLYPIVNGYEIKPNGDLKGANLAGANLSGLNLEGANLYQANLTNANLSGANLRNATFDSCAMVGANLTGVKARQATFNQASMARADLTGAELGLTSFCETNLYQAKFINADLTQADLKYAKLREANLTGANITGADLEGAVFVKTIMPDGTVRNE